MTTTTMQELDQRTNDGIDVRMLWDPADGRIVVTVDDARTGEAFAVDVRPGDDPVDVFRHPFAYAAWQGAAGATALAA